MDKFISFDGLSEPMNYFYTKQHFILLFISLIIIIFFSMYASRQKLKFQKWFVFLNAILIIILEFLRIFWRYKYLEYNGQNVNFINVAQLDFFTVSLWISIPILVLAPIIKKKKSREFFALPFVFYISTLIAIITLIYPTNINAYFDFYHCYNLIYTLLRSLIIMLGLMLAFAKWISVGKFLDLWKAILSTVFLGIVCYLFYFFLKDTSNLFLIDFCPLFESLGIHLKFPFHLLLIWAFIFFFQIIIYLPFRIYDKKQNY